MTYTFTQAEVGNICADFSGKQVGRSHRHALNMSAEYRQPFGSGRGIKQPGGFSLVRALYAVGTGTATGMYSTLLADYAVERDCGKFSAIGGMLNGRGVAGAGARRLAGTACRHRPHYRGCSGGLCVDHHNPVFRFEKRRPRRSAALANAGDARPQNHRRAIEP